MLLVSPCRGAHVIQPRFAAENIDIEALAGNQGVQALALPAVRYECAQSGGVMAEALVKVVWIGYNCMSYGLHMHCIFWKPRASSR
jgi:hypothetical protein